jgi:HprK-related kinase B
VTAITSLPEQIDTPFVLDLAFGDVPVRVRTNALEILTALRRYYAPWVAADGARPASVVALIQGEPAADGPFEVIDRGPGRRPKEAVLDVAGGRLIRKLATGVLMDVRRDEAFAVGDLLTNLNQAVNLINARYAEVVLARGYVLLHASAVSREGGTVALAGPPGAGKSTAALHLVEHGFRFLSNDRVLARPVDGAVEARGYPKQPRVNPGTLLYHPRLVGLLEPAAQRRLRALPPRALWALEDKRDVDLDAIYGDGTVELVGTLRALVLLGWAPDGQGFRVRRLDTDAALASLPVVRKDLGAFDLVRDTRRRAVRELLRYVLLLRRVDVLRVEGAVDMKALIDVVGERLSR